MEPVVTYSAANAVAYVTINRPGARNSVSQEVCDGLNGCVLQADVSLPAGAGHI